MMTIGDRLPNLRHLEAVGAIHAVGSVSAAAATVHLSQPAVTQALRQIESLFGARLFVRTPAGMQPTEAGIAAVLRIGRALEQIRTGIAEARRQRPAREPAASRLLTATQLQALAATVESGGFGAAARALDASRAVLHRAVKEAERSLETPLFERTSHGVRPTRAAELLVRRIRLAQREIEQAHAELAALGGGDRGRTVIGAMPLARSSLVPATVLEFAARHPRHTVAILDGPYENMLDALRRGAADCLVGALRDPNPFGDVLQEHLFDDPLAIIARAGHPLARLKRVTPAALARYAWIVPRAESPLRRQFEELRNVLSPALLATGIECNSLVAARALLLSSDRLMLLSAHQVHHEITTGQLTALTHPLGRVLRPIGLTTRRDWHPTAAQRDLVALLRARAHALSTR
jgi:DNA-binding transcriptional LysR family regulator